MPVDDTWASRDLPVLEAAVRGVDEQRAHGGIRFHDIAQQTGLSDDDVYRAARALDDAGLIELRLVMPSTHGRVMAVSGQARQIVGSWPNEETYVDRLLAAVDALAENASDEDTRSRLRKLRDGLTEAGRDLLVSVAAATISGQIPK